MSAGRFFEDHVEDLANNGDFIPDIESLTDTGAVEIHNILHGGDCDVFVEYDPDDDDSFALSIEIDNLTGEGITQINKIEINSNNEKMRLRINNTSGSTAHYAVTGVEVLD